MIAGGIAGAGYFIVYKKMMKGGKADPAAECAVGRRFFLLSCSNAFRLHFWTAFPGWSDTRMMPLFYSYREACTVFPEQNGEISF